jgi:Icc-related predicted phosphoesterase
MGARPGSPRPWRDRPGSVAPMRVHVVSDVHGNAEALKYAGDGADALIVLGDLVDYVDYADPTAGILGRVLGAEVSARFATLRTDGAPGELATFIRARWDAMPDARAVLDEAVREQYDAMFAAMTVPTYAIPGNVDLPAIWPDYARPDLAMPDGRVVTIGGLRFGFVGGAPLPPGHVMRSSGPWTPHMIAAPVYAAAVDALGELDVLCSHAPAAIPDMVYDTVTRRFESWSPELLALIRRQRPRAALSGHIHQPLARRVRLGPTECVNVGYFRRTGTPYVLRW